MVHVQNATVANAAVVASVRFPNIAHFAIPTPLRLVPHVETPIRWHDTRICHNAIVERHEKVSKENVVYGKHDDCIDAW